MLVAGSVLVITMAVVLAVQSLLDDEAESRLSLTTSASMFVAYGLGIPLVQGYYIESLTVAFFSSLLLVVKRELHEFAWGSPARRYGARPSSTSSHSSSIHSSQTRASALERHRREDDLATGYRGQRYRFCQLRDGQTPRGQGYGCDRFLRGASSTRPRSSPRWPRRRPPSPTSETSPSALSCLSTPGWPSATPSS